jgi:L-gulonate 5-dehydrogenase
MRAAVTRGRGVMEVLDVPPPGDPAAGEAILRPELVGVCGSDVHIFHGDLGDELFPRIQGHELSAVVEAVGEGVEGLRAGERVAVWPVLGCGRCYPCSIGRENVCSNIRIIGVHVDGGLRERFAVPAEHAFGVGDLPARAAAFIEPTSIAVRAVARARIAAGERVVVLGAGPIGQAVCLAARARGASVLLADRLEARLERARDLGADEVLAGSAEEIAPAVREWAGPEGPPVVVEAIGVPEAVRGAVEMVSTAGRVVIVGLSDREVSLPIGAFPFRELDVLGTSCCSAAEFAEAVALVRAHREQVEGLITHEFALAEAPAALAHVAEHPAEVMKAVIRMEG